MKVRFWGVRGSCPSPIGSDDVRSRLSEALRLLHHEKPALDLSDESAVEQWLDTLAVARHGRGWLQHVVRRNAHRQR